MELSISSSSSRPEGAARSLWNKVSQNEWQAPTSRATCTCQCQRAQDKERNIANLESLLFFNFCGLLIYTIFRLDAFLRIYNASQTLESTSFSLYNLHNLVSRLIIYNHQDYNQYLTFIFLTLSH